jgi:hypothetical protein
MFDQYCWLAGEFRGGFNTAFGVKLLCCFGFRFRENWLREGRQYIKQRLLWSELRNWIQIQMHSTSPFGHGLFVQVPRVVLLLCCAYTGTSSSYNPGCPIPENISPCLHHCSRRSIASREDPEQLTRRFLNPKVGWGQDGQLKDHLCKHSMDSSPVDATNTFPPIYQPTLWLELLRMVMGGTIFWLVPNVKPANGLLHQTQW